MNCLTIDEFDAEAERCEPVTDAEVARGCLEPGWVLTRGPATVCYDGEHHSLTSLQRAWRVQRDHRESWAVLQDGRWSCATKTRLPHLFADPLLQATDASDLAPGAVFLSRDGRTDDVYVRLPEDRMRRLGRAAPLPVDWTAARDNFLICACN